MQKHGVCMFFGNYWHDAARRQNLNLILLKGQKRVFRPSVATRCTDSRQTWHTRRAPVSAWMCTISPQSAQDGGNAAHKNHKFPLLVNSRLAGLNSLTDF